MTETDTRTSYSTVAMTLHWLIALAIVFNLASGFLDSAIAVHKATGITILCLSVMRLLWRLTHRPPPLPSTVKVWEKGLAHVTHWTFYVLMIMIPVSGWMMVSTGSRKYPLSWYGLFDIPFLPVAQDKLASAGAGQAHEVLGIAMAVLLALHILGAIKHQFLDGDDTVARMLPLGR